MARDKDKEKEDPHRQIVPVLSGEAAAIFDWLEDVFRLSPRDSEPGKPKTGTDSMPERITLRMVFGQGGKDHGPEIKSETWKPMVSPLPSREKLVELANKFHGLAQRDASAASTLKPQKTLAYGLFAYSNLQSSNSYARHIFSVEPGHREYTEKEAPAVDDEDTHHDRLRREEFAHFRWHRAQSDEFIGGMFKLLMEQLRQSSEVNLRLQSANHQQFLSLEDALSKKQDREIAQKKADMLLSAGLDVWNTVKGLLPAVVVYATKGKAGIIEGLKSFDDGLTEETRLALFGKWQNGAREEAGILDEYQTQLFAGMIEGKIDPKRTADLIASLSTDQMTAAQGVLSIGQIQLLVGLGRAVTETSEQNGA